MTATADLTGGATPPPLACPLCDTVRRALRTNQDGSVTYRCPPDHHHHGNTYTWRIAADGALRG